MAQAESWVALRDRELSDKQRRELERWLAESPLHRQAFAQADTKMTDIDWALHAGAVDEILEGLQAKTRQRIRR